jgi:hypothetical protein
MHIGFAISAGLERIDARLATLGDGLQRNVVELRAD